MQDHSQEENNNTKKETIEYTTQDDTTRRPETRRTGTKRDTKENMSETSFGTPKEHPTSAATQCDHHNPRSNIWCNTSMKTHTANTASDIVSEKGNIQNPVGGRFARDFYTKKDRLLHLTDPKYRFF